jgi:hypothetical protein
VDVVELRQHLKSAGADTLEFVELAPFLLGTEYFDGDRQLSTYLKEQNIAAMLESATKLLTPATDT